MASRAALQSRKQLIAAALTRPLRCGCSSASSKISQSDAIGAVKTLDAPPITAGTPASRKASRAIVACALVRTSTATSPGCTARKAGSPSSVAGLISVSESSKPTMSAATSSAIRGRSASTRNSPLALSGSPGERDNTRNRSGMWAREPRNSERVRPAFTGR